VVLVVQVAVVQAHLLEIILLQPMPTLAAAVVEHLKAILLALAALVLLLSDTLSKNFFISY
jgi:hypothetical protein